MIHGHMIQKKKELEATIETLRTDLKDTTAELAMKDGFLQEAEDKLTKVYQFIEECRENVNRAVALDADPLVAEKAKAVSEFLIGLQGFIDQLDSNDSETSADC